MSLTRLTWLLALIFVGGANTLVAEKQEHPDPISVVDKMDVDVMNVEVYAVDKQGVPVTDLTRDDFRLFGNGKKIPVSNFFYEGSGGPLFFTVYLDNTRVGHEPRGRVLKRLSIFLEKRLHAGDFVSVASFNGEVYEEQTFTRDAELFRKAISRTGRRSSARGLDSIGSIVSDRRALAAGSSQSGCPRYLSGDLWTYSRQSLIGVRDSVHGLKEYAHTLGVLPGRRVIFFVSNGIPLVPGEDLANFLSESCLDDSGPAVRGSFSLSREAKMPAQNVFRHDFRGVHQFDATNTIRELARFLNSQRVAFFPILVADEHAPDHGVVEARGYGGVNQSNIRVVASRASALPLLATQTGGQLIHDRSQLPVVLDRWSTSFESYYSLGFRPLVASNDEEVKVKIKVNRPGIRLHYRRTIKLKSLTEELSERTRLALLRLPSSNTLAIGLESGLSEPFDTNLSTAVLWIQIPLEKLALLPMEGMYIGNVSIYLASQDSQGRFAPVRSTSIPVSIPSPEIEVARRKFLRYRVKMLLRRDLHRISVGVRDEIGGTESYVTGEIAANPVPTPLESDPAMLSIVRPAVRNDREAGERLQMLDYYR